MIHLTEAFGGHRGGFDPATPFEVELGEHVEAGNVSARPHPDLPLTIFNYTPQCAYARTWDDVTLACRGLVLDFGGNIIARPFAKFFNLGEHETLPTETPKHVYDKLDGSLGIAYQYDGHIGIATRGSFTSEQALWATEWLLQNYPEWVPPTDATALFEIIYPDNRIVVNYEGMSDLILLDVIDNKTGLPLGQEVAAWPGRSVESFMPQSLNELVRYANERKNTEGFVCVWEDGARIKIKSDDYVEMHRIVTGLSNRRVWEHLKDGGTIASLCEIIPDEFHEWVTQIGNELTEEHDIIQRIAEKQLRVVEDKLGSEATRAELAEGIKRTSYPGLCFALLDNRDIREMIFKMIKPERESPILSVEDE